VEIREKLFEGHHAQRAILRRTRDEAVIAAEVANGARDLEPKIVQMVKRQ
jgi:hypothetical protein